MKKLVLLVALVVLFSGFSASAKTNTPINSSTQAQIDDINNLTTQIKALQAERKSKLSTLLTQLKQGSKGDAVTTLQTLLALDPSVYPEGQITGYYGKFTAQAVKKFQQKNGLEQVGNVGPRTLEKLKKFADDNDLTAEDESSNENESDSDENENNVGQGRGMGQMKRLCAIVPPGHLIAPGQMKKNGGMRPTIPTCQTLPKGIKDKIDGIKPLPDQSDKIAPVISNVQTSEITATSVKVTWTTNESSKSKVWHSTATPVVIDTATTAGDNLLVTNHSVVLTSLNPSTAYYFIVGSMDLAGNLGKSTEGNFTTLAPDTTDPVISNLSSSDITATTVKITWTTNESAKDKIWYGTVDPVATNVTANMTDNTLRTSHTFNLSGLTTSTIYYYKVSSTDSSGNDTMSSQGTFTTSS